MSWTSYLAVTVLFAIAVSAGSLKDIKHVVLFMQENRAFDHVSVRLSSLER
jgi:phospholipase C